MAKIIIRIVETAIQLVRLVRDLVRENKNNKPKSTPNHEVQE